MTKVLVFGNSHVGSLKAGLNNLDKKYLENISFDFAAIVGETFYEVYLENNQLNIPERKLKKFSGVFGNIQFPIDLDPYDYFVLAGGVISPIKELISSQSKFTYYSKNLIENYIDNFYLENTRNKDLISKLTKLFCSKVIIIPPPLHVLPVQNELEVDSIPESKFVAKQINLIRSICDNVSKEKNKVSILLPPKKLLENNQLNTKQNYIRGGLKWDATEHNRENDLSHMNADYGKEIMLSLIDNIELKN